MEWKRCSVFEFSDSDGMMKSNIWKVTAEASINSIKNDACEVEEIMKGTPTNFYKFYYKWSFIFDESWVLFLSLVFDALS